MKPALPSVIRIFAGVTVAVPVLGLIAAEYLVRLGIREQTSRNAAARPLFDSLITRHIQAGATVESAIRVINDAGIRYSDDHSQSMIVVLYSTGPGSGIHLYLRYDQARCVRAVEVREGVTSL